MFQKKVNGIEYKAKKIFWKKLKEMQTYFSLPWKTLLYSECSIKLNNSSKSTFFCYDYDFPRVKDITGVMVLAFHDSNTS